MIRSRISIDNLIRILQYGDIQASMDDRQSPELLAAVIRCIVCVYIDAEPQATIIVPEITRLWAEIEDHPEKVMSRRNHHGEKVRCMLRYVGKVRG